MMYTGEASDRGNALNLIDLFLIVWRNKWWVIVTCLVSVGIALIYVLTAQDWYRAEVLLKLVDSRQGQGLGQLGGIGGLANLAGFDVGTNRSAEPIAVLTSREFTGAFIESQNLLPVFFSKQWDPIAKNWKQQAIADRPDIRDGIEYFDAKILKVQEDKKTGLITLAVEWTDAATAATWANLLVDRVNERMRQRALTESESNMSYLKQELANTNIVTLQQSVGRVLESELQKLMLAKANKEFSFRIIDHALAPKRSAHPHRALIVAAAFFMGLAISGIFVVARQVVRVNRSLRGGIKPSISQ